MDACEQGALDINLATYGASDVVRSYSELAGFTDEGERVALDLVAEEIRSQPILDIGVGGGRTTALLRAISDDYLGLDLSPELIQACKTRHPGVRLAQGDARDLSSLPESHFALVVFSYNGIDSVDHGDRQQIMREVHRVLRPGGLFLMSSHNRLGPVTATRQWAWPTVSFSPNPLRLGVRMLRAARTAAVRAQAYRRYAKQSQWHEDRCSAFVLAHDRGLMIYHATRKLTCAQLEQSGFAEDIRVVSANDGALVGPSDDTSDTGWFHFIARKPQQPIALS